MRIGYQEAPFRLYKFRTLTDAIEENMQQRETPYGSWLRGCSLDELPQLINVIKGEMSLVGPRPLPTYYESLFSDKQRIRFKVKPGITGLAQVNGGAQLSWNKKFEYDLKYVQNQSFWSDIGILLRTISVIFRKKDDGLEEQPFTGEL
jgi:lipopolysaccharide/colanic/teichoic acid biosynthesis glycosyltransferase